MKLLIDTNVLLDMVLKRNGYDISVKLFKKIREQTRNRPSFRFQRPPST